MKQEEVLSQIQDAEMVLVGLGEEFDGVRAFGNREDYCRDRELLQDSESSYLIPLLQRVYRQKAEAQDEDRRIQKALEHLAHALDNKNYFIVSTSVNGKLLEIPWKEGRLVMPCGSELQKQCADGCDGGLGRVTDAELEALIKNIPEKLSKLPEQDEGKGILGVCPVCGKMLQLNNIYHAGYDEKGYLDDWQRYTKWLQGTLNRKVLVLELGVGMMFPSVIRWPFEKVAFFNQKATFYRINENLYQLTEELAGKGTAIAENVIDWLQNLC